MTEQEYNIEVAQLEEKIKYCERKIATIEADIFGLEFNKACVQKEIAELRVHIASHNTEFAKTEDERKFTTES